MKANTATNFSPIVSDEKKIDISLNDNEATIKLSTWTDALGWTCQKTLQVDSEMLDELHHVISAARYKINKQKAVENEEIESNKIIEFPCIR